MKSKKRSKPNGVYRDKDKLVVREGAKFPDRCVICNEECDASEPQSFVFEREGKSHYVDLALVQTVAHAAKDLITGTSYTGPVEVSIPLCAWHAKRRMMLILIGGVIGGISIAHLVIRYLIGGANEFDVLRISALNVVAIFAAIIGIWVLIAGLSNAVTIWFSPIKYYDRFVWLRGAGAAYLNDLPFIEKEIYKSDVGNKKLGIHSSRDEADLTAEELIRRGGLDDA